MTATPGALASAFLDGTIVALALLCALVAIVLRDRLYAIYSASLGSYVVYQALEGAYVNGPEGPRLVAALAELASLALGAVFARDFLELGAGSRRYRLLLVLLGLVAATVGIVALWPGGPTRAGVFTEAVPLGAAALLAYQLWLGIDAMSRGRAVARWYALGCAGLAAGLILHASGLYGVVPATMVTAGLGGAGVAWQALFISLALAGRVRTLDERTSSLESIAFRDALTGLANRRALDARLADEWRRGARAGSRLAVVMIDVDRFKSYNDALGHPRGDVVLHDVAQALASVARRTDDFVARYGGEEFAVVLPGLARAGATAMAEAMRTAVEALAIPHPSSASGVVTISCGVALTRPRHGREPGRLIAAADRALYAAKMRGRNCVVTARPRAPSPTDSKNR